MTWTIFLIAIVSFNLGLVTFCLVVYLTEEYRRRHRLRKLARGRMVPISVHPRYDKQRRAL